MSELARDLQASIGRVLQGKDAAIELVLVALFAGGHVLIEDQPGVGKTLLARSLARSLDLPFQRIQCTADLLPSDVLGAQVYQPRTGELLFRQGPVFTSILLADELNRTPPRTQSALLECMAERSVTLDRQTHELPDPFFVIATQNPLTAAGTYPLPESQLDRFLLRIHLGYPDPEHEIDIVAREDGHRQATEIRPVGGRDALGAARARVDAVHIERDLTAFIVELARSTRTAPGAVLGVSTRGAQSLHRACRARAVVHGRDYVVPDDVRALLVPAFAHRMVVRGGGDPTALLHEILAETPIPE